MICFPNAKINIGLFVTGKRTDGYHDLETIFYPVAVRDALEIIPSDDLTMQVHGLDIAGDHTQNLVWKAWQLLHAEYPGKVKQLSIHLLKNIPMGAGLGGGSADAAFMLDLMCRYFGLDLDRAQLAAYALKLGSDCPFFIYNAPCLAKGRGEELQKLDLDLSNYSIQLICPKVHITTADAFGNIKPAAAPFNLEDITQIELKDWSRYIKNDFEEHIFKTHPKLGMIKEQLYAQGAIYAAMSGTGSTIYGIFEKGGSADIRSDLEFIPFFV